MKASLPSPHPKRPRLALFASLALACGPAAAFEVPDFSAELFSRDGVFLASDERSSVLEALAALASNFAGSTMVDDDLREKALALALALDPLHYHSRLALRALEKGGLPERTPFFDSLPALSETLWSTGMHLSEIPVDPEEKRLAIPLLELSLLTHPDPPTERLATLGRISGGEAPAWEKALKLSRENNPSTGRAANLYRRALGRAEDEQRAQERAEAKPDPRSMPADEPAPRPSFEPVTRTLATVRWLNYESGHAQPGTVTLTLRAPDGGTERRWLEEKTAAADLLPLLASERDLPVTGLEIPRSLVVEKNWTWPAGVLAETSFASDLPWPGPRRLLDASATLPALVLAEAALTGSNPNPDFILLGDADRASGEARLLGRAVPQIEVARNRGGRYLLVPEAAFAELFSHVRESGSLDLLFGPELIAYSTASEAAGRLLQPTGDDLAAADAILTEIKTASQRMPLPELARLPSAQERLRSLLAACPAHLSARIMLDYGQTPPTEKEVLRLFAGKVHAIVEPFLVLAGADLAEADAGTGVGTVFLKLRTECPSAARNLLDAAEDVHEAAALYQQFANKTSSLAVQRLRETRTAIARYEAERSALGLTATGPE